MPWAIGLSLVVHGAVLAVEAPQASRRPAYIVLETRLQTEGNDRREGRFLALDRRSWANGAPASGQQNVQSATGTHSKAPRALSDLTLPDGQRGPRFEPGDTMGNREADRSPVRLPPDLSRYYRAAELDVLAEPRAHAEPDLSGPRFTELGQRRLRIRLFVNEVGQVDDVELHADELPAGIGEEIRGAFFLMSFYPALRDGVVVKSQKTIELVLGDTEDAAIGNAAVPTGSTDGPVDQTAALKR